MSSTVPLEDLVLAARKAREQAYAPYSKFLVGAALEVEGGEFFTGCNVENASYGLSNCAERVAIGSAVSAGHRRFVRIVVVGGDGGPIPPCGACRQVMVEFSPDLEVIGVSASAADGGDEVGQMTPNRPMITWRMEDLLPHSFRLDE